LEQLWTIGSLGCSMLMMRLADSHCGVFQTIIVTVRARSN